MARACDRDGARHPLGSAWLTVIVPSGLDDTRRQLWRFCSPFCALRELEDLVDEEAVERLREARALAYDEEDLPW
jgi:hypothetical protein